jgi:carbamoyltransferase
MRDLTVVGLNIGHDGGCAILKGDRVRIAISEERLNRSKYSPGWLSSLLYCLASTGTKLDEIDLFVFSAGGLQPPQGYTAGLSWIGAQSDRFISVDHHLSHAIGSFCLSPFDKALVVVLDALGNDNATESYYIGDFSRIERIGGNAPSRLRAKGIGATYEAFTNFLGFTDQESGKTMALASYGDAFAFRTPLFEVYNDQVASELENTHQWGVIEFAKKFGLPFGEYFPNHASEAAWNVAAYVQRQTEDAVLQLLRNLMSATGINNLCLSGGVALNCSINTRIWQELGPSGLFVLPPASDTGQALGNALYGYYYLTGELPRHALCTASFGRHYTNEEIELSLKRDPWTTPFGRLLEYRFAYQRESNITHTVADLLTQGKTVGWLEGGSELGPRALGNRSILADPRSPHIRDILNATIKHREWFRPFAPSILLEEYPSWFHLDHPSPFMLEAPLVRKEHALKIPAVLHRDQTARLQTVEKTVDTLFYDLITEFWKITGVPMVLNTSFNDREPIVETPGHALFTYLTSELDYLVMGEYLVEKRRNG